MRKPPGIILNVLVLFLTGIVGFFGSLGLLIAGIDTSVLEMFSPLYTYAKQITIMLMLMGITYMILGYFLWQLEEWAWWISLAIHLGIGVALPFILWVLNPSLWYGSIVTIGLNIILVLALFNRDTIIAVEPEDIRYNGWTL